MKNYFIIIITMLSSKLHAFLILPLNGELAFFPLDLQVKHSQAIDSHKSYHQL